MLTRKERRLPSGDWDDERGVKTLILLLYRLMVKEININVILSTLSGRIASFLALIVIEEYY